MNDWLVIISGRNRLSSACVDRRARALLRQGGQSEKSNAAAKPEAASSRGRRRVARPCRAPTHAGRFAAPKMSECESSAEVRNLHQRQADIALRLLRPQAPDLVVRRLRSLRFGFYADSGYLRRSARTDWQFLTLSTQNPLSRWAQEMIGSGAGLQRFRTDQTRHVHRTWRRLSACRQRASGRRLAAGGITGRRPGSARRSPVSGDARRRARSGGFSGSGVGAGRRKIIAEITISLFSSTVQNNAALPCRPVSLTRRQIAPIGFMPK